MIKSEVYTVQFVSAGDVILGETSGEHSGDKLGFSAHFSPLSQCLASQIVLRGD